MGDPRDLTFKAISELDTKGTVVSGTDVIILSRGGSPFTATISALADALGV